MAELDKTYGKPAIYDYPAADRRRHLYRRYYEKLKEFNEHLLCNYVYGCDITGSCRPLELDDVDE